jgi:hypothetical protein
MVAIAPSSKDRVADREACVAAWKAFADSARIKSWRETDTRIDVYNGGKTAIVTYKYHITYQSGGQSMTAHGRDMYVLVEESGRWWAVADQFQE